MEKYLTAKEAADKLRVNVYLRITVSPLVV